MIQGDINSKCPWNVEGSVKPGEYLAFKLYLDGHIKSGKTYRVRPTGHEECLFHGKPVKLVHIRPAEYCYRLRFEIPEEECTDPEDEKSRCIYTDNWQPEGLALTEVVRKAG